MVDQALATGLYFSINPAMVRSTKAMPLLQRLPPERVLLETDGPFARSGNRSAVPSDLLGTLDHLARLWGMSTGEARKAVAQNEQRLRCTTSEPPPA